MRLIVSVSILTFTLAACGAAAGVLQALHDWQGLGQQPHQPQLHVPAAVERCAPDGSNTRRRPLGHHRRRASPWTPRPGMSATAEPC